MQKNDKKNNTPLSHDNFVRKSLSDKKIWTFDKILPLVKSGISKKYII